jgi:hypothetical protein
MFLGKVAALAEKACPMGSVADELGGASASFAEVALATPPGANTLAPKGA